MKRSAMKRTEFKRKPEHKRLKFRGRPSKDVTKKSGRVILTANHYVGLCQEVWTRDRGECQIRRSPRCWLRLPRFSTAWCDHIEKRSQGGSDTLENLRLACPPCHDWADNQGGKNRIRKELERERMS